MLRLSATLFAAVSVIAFTQIALAADLPRKAPAYRPSPPVYSWTGFYIGLNAGYGWDHDGIDNTATSLFCNIDNTGCFPTNQAGIATAADGLEFLEGDSE